jgi:hypothetical protein
MKKGFSISPGTGAQAAVDEIAGLEHQIVKIGIGPDGEAEFLEFGQEDMDHSIPTVMPNNDPIRDQLGAKVTAVAALGAGGSGIIGWLSQIWDKLNGTLAVSGPLTDAQLRASAVPVSAATLPLPSGAASAANQATGNASLASIDGKLGGTIATAPVAGENHIGQVGGAIAVATASFQRPADTLAYAVGDAILDSTTAATVNANTAAGSAGIMRLHVARATDKTGMIRRLRLKTNDTAFAAATVRVHLFRDRPTVTNGDNGAFLPTESNYIGYADVVLDRHFSDAEKGLGVPAIGSEWNFDPAPGTDYIHAILETRTAITTPGSAKTWTLAAEAHQN